MTWNLLIGMAVIPCNVIIACFSSLSAGYVKIRILNSQLTLGQKFLFWAYSVIQKGYNLDSNTCFITLRNTKTANCILKHVKCIILNECRVAFSQPGLISPSSTTITVFYSSLAIFNLKISDQRQRWQSFNLGEVYPR